MNNVYFKFIFIVGRLIIQIVQILKSFILLSYLIYGG